MERAFVDWLRRRLPTHPLLRLGPGDDAAVLSLAGRSDCVITVDLLSDGVDFNLKEIDPRRAGRKCLAVNLSDLAAMAAEPLAGVVALCLPRSDAYDLAVALYEGFLPLAERYRLAIAGGDTNTWDGLLVVSITLIGVIGPRGPLCRGGATPGDRILVTGAFGGSLLGRHLDFEPRVGEALKLHNEYGLHAGIDVSDSLALDLWRMMTASGCGAVINAAAVPIAPAAGQLAALREDGVTPLEHALTDGEDFELLLAAPEDEARRLVAAQPLDVPITDIGEFTSEPGLWLLEPDGTRRPLQPCGWEH